MVLEREDQFASLIPALFAMRLVTVRASSVWVTQNWAIISQNSKVNSSIRKATEVFWLSRQSWRLRCSFGTTFLPSGWRPISFGNQIGISWRGSTSFSATCLLLTPFGLFSIVNLMSLLFFFISFFLRSNGGKFNAGYMLEGNFREWRSVKSTRPHIYTKLKELILWPVFMIIGLFASEREFNPTVLVQLVLIGVYQWSSRCGHGPYGIGTSGWPLSFRYFTTFVGVRVSSPWSDLSIPPHVHRI